jgi:hypothetical protein
LIVPVGGMRHDPAMARLGLDNDLVHSHTDDPSHPRGLGLLEGVAVTATPDSRRTAGCGRASFGSWAEGTPSAPVSGLG